MTTIAKALLVSATLALSFAPAVHAQGKGSTKNDEVIGETGTPAEKLCDYDGLDCT